MAKVQTDAKATGTSWLLSARRTLVLVKRFSTIPVCLYQGPLRIDFGWPCPCGVADFARLQIDSVHRRVAPRHENQIVPSELYLSRFRKIALPRRHRPWLLGWNNSDTAKLDDILDFIS